MPLASRSAAARHDDHEPGGMVRDDDLWVFGYGSLMWDPGFPHLEATPALLRGYHRAFSVYSTINWGSPQRPGLVLALVRGGSCRGRAFRVAAAERAAALDYLDRREAVYLRRQVPVAVDGGTIGAVTYVADEGHPSFAGRLRPEDAARLIRQGAGAKGTARDYLENTIRHLDESGVTGTALHRLSRLVETLDGD